MRVLVGTSGFSYKEWKGRFYPEKLPADQMLRFYASRFNAVEMNNTFYRMPSEKVLLDWGKEVPDGFTFAIKAPRRITHEKRLQDAGQETGYFLKTVTLLGTKLGPTLFQLPPNFKKDLPRLEAFLALLPNRWRSAFEFRHPSWFAEEVFSMLRSRDAALCVAETGEPGDGPFEATASWGYLRLRKVAYQPGELESWAERVRRQNWNDAYVFFKHEDEATGPRLAAEFMKSVSGA
ncbi:MAG: DUF72 domain-containing protein [Gemmatimonadetes bacterium]|nr:DUF72 domain-containing protein [Gemmatimonadota bacterium]